MPLCRPPCLPRLTYPSECPYAREPDVNICCLSTTATLVCTPSGSLAVSWSEDRSGECVDRPLGTNLNGVMRSEWFAAAAMSAYTCLFGGILPATLQARLGTQWSYDCSSGLVMFSCYLEIRAIGGGAGNLYHFARSTVAPDWYLSAPITVTCDDLDPELVQTVACAGATVSLTCAVVSTCSQLSCLPKCVIQDCPETGNMHRPLYLTVTGCPNLAALAPDTFPTVDGGGFQSGTFGYGVTSPPGEPPVAQILIQYGCSASGFVRDVYVDDTDGASYMVGPTLVSNICSGGSWSDTFTLDLVDCGIVTFDVFSDGGDPWEAV